MLNTAQLFRSEPLNEIAAEYYGWSVVETADSEIEAQRQIDPQDPWFHAAARCRGMAFVLDDMRYSAKGTTADERAGMKLQAAWWHEIAEEISEREGA